MAALVILKNAATAQSPMMLTSSRSLPPAAAGDDKEMP
jgi:hypothetical protein